MTTLYEKKEVIRLARKHLEPNPTGTDTELLAQMSQDERLWPGPRVPSERVLSAYGYGFSEYVKREIHKRVVREHMKRSKSVFSEAGDHPPLTFAIVGKATQAAIDLERQNR